MEPVTCPHCKAPNTPGRSGCARCGRPLPGAGPRGAPPPAPPAPSEKAAPFRPTPEQKARIDDLRRQIEQRPEASALYIQLSELYAGAGRRDLAAEVLLELMERDPRNAYLRHKLDLLRRPPPARRARTAALTGRVARRSPPAGRFEELRDALRRKPRLAAGIGLALALGLVGAWWLWPGTRPVVAGDFSAYQPRWAPHGRSFAFLISEGDRAQLAVYDLDEGAHRVLGAVSSWGGEAFAWSPDGLRLAFVAPPEGDSWEESIALVDAGGGPPRRIASGSSPLWYLDSTTLLARCSVEVGGRGAWEEDWSVGLCRIDTATGRSDRVGPAPPWRAAFSPLLDKLAFESFVETDEGAASVPEGDGEFQEFVDAVIRDDPSNFAGGSRNVSRELEARRYMDEGGTGGVPPAGSGTDVFVRDLRGRPAPLTTDHRSSLVSWTPDGEHVLLTTAESGGLALWRIAPDGSGRELLLDASLGIADPQSVALSADGQYVFFASAVEADAGIARIMTGEDPLDLHVARVGASSAERLENRHPFKQRFAVSPDGRHIVYEVFTKAGGLRGGGKSELWLMPR